MQAITGLTGFFHLILENKLSNKVKEASGSDAATNENTKPRVSGGTFETMTLYCEGQVSKIKCTNLGNDLGFKDKLSNFLGRKEQFKKKFDLKKSDGGLKKILNNISGI